MGLDMSYQAIPAECELIDRARQDDELGEMLCVVARWFRTGVGPKAWPEAEKLWRELCELAAQHPGLEKRNCFLDRWWDKLHYLLSANRRDEAGSEEDDLFDKALRGTSVMMLKRARAPQYLPVKYVAPAEVEMIAVLLQSMSTESLRVHYVPTKMEASGVYKFWADRADESEWTHISDYFTDFRTFYLEAARHKEGVIVCLD